MPGPETKVMGISTTSPRLRRGTDGIVVVVSVHSWITPAGCQGSLGDERPEFSRLEGLFRNERTDLLKELYRNHIEWELCLVIDLGDGTQSIGFEVVPVGVSEERHGAE